MPVARFYCVHCGAPLKTSAELTPEKRIQCPKCETIFPVPAQLLPPSEKPAGTMQLRGDLTTGIGAESPRVQLVGMEDILGPATPETPAPASPARSPIPEAPAESPEPAPQAQSAPEPWEEELGQDAATQPYSEAEATPSWTGEELDQGQQPSEVVSEPQAIGPAEPHAIDAEPGEEVVATPEPEEVYLGEQETEQKSSLWLWLVLLAAVLLLVSGVTLAWYMGWLDPVLELLGLQTPKPSAGSPVVPVSPPSSQTPPVGDSSQAGTTPASAKPGPVDIVPGKGALAPDFLGTIEKVFSEAPARPIAEMQTWRYVPNDANLVICINCAELTLHPMVRQLIEKQLKQAPLLQKPDQLLPIDPSEVREVLIAFRVDWEKMHQEQVGQSLVGTIIWHHPWDEPKVRELVQATAKDVREEKIGQRTVYHATDMVGNRMFSCLVAPNVLVAGVSGREKAVPGLTTEPHAAIPKEWEGLARSAGNAQFAVLVRDLQLATLWKQLGPPPPEALPYVQVSEKARHALAKLEFTPKMVHLHLNATFSDSQVAQKAAQLLQQLVDEQIKPNVPQLAGVAPELAQELQKNLRIAAEAESVQLTASASYPALGNAIKNLMAFFAPGLQGKPTFPPPRPMKPKP